MSLEQTAKGLEVSSTLQRKIRERIERDKLTTEQLAELLGLLPVGAEVLLARDEWTLDTVFRVAEAVGLEFKVKLESAGG